MAIFPGSAIPSAVSDYEIDNSVRFNAGDSSYLARTPGSASNRKTWTMSCWVKVTGNDNGLVLMDAGSNPNYLVVYIYQGTIRLYDPSGGGGSNEIYIAGTRLLRDPSAWYHIVVQLDTTESTNTDRVKIYVNNERETAFTQTDWPDEDYESFINNNIEHTINRTGSTYSDCYMAEYYFIDGTALTPSSFAELDSKTNQWKPLDSDDVKDAVTFGTNGFYQKYNSTELAASFADSAWGYKVNTFTSNGTLTVPSGGVTADILIVAGGGGGGGAYGGHKASGGGGGAGGLLEGTSISLNAGDYTVTVGDGGAGGSFEGNSGGASIRGIAGSNSSLSNGTWGTATAIGGGYGGAASADTGGDGGSGGAASGYWQSSQSGGDASQGIQMV